jgi:p21-activated kinase 1
MDQERSSGFRFRRPNSKLHKDPPQFSRALKSQQSNPSLKRHPSAPVYPRGHAGRGEHTRTRSNAYGSSSSSIDQQSASAGHSPVLANGEFASSSSSQQTFKSRIGRFSFTNGKSADELISPPFDARGMPNVLEETDSSELDRQETSSDTSQRPPRLQTYHTSPAGGLQTLRQSASYSALQPRMDTALPPIQDASAAKRNSDDGNVTKQRRKGTF